LNRAEVHTNPALLLLAVLAHTQNDALAKVQGMLQRAVLLQGFQLAGLEVRPLEGEIRGHVGSQHVHPKAMEVLVCLAQRPGKVVQRIEVLDQVWGHYHGSDRALTRCISELRHAIGDHESENRVIETIPKRGYRLVAEPKTLRLLAEDPKSSTGLSEKPSIAVLPFVNISSDPEQEYFSDGITEDIITDLSRFPDLFVIARNSSFTFKGKSVAVQDVSRQLGARYILEGSVRRFGKKIRVTAQLADSSKGSQIWAERYDRDLTDVFAVQDDIKRQILSVLPTKLTGASQSTTRTRQTVRNMEAYEYVLRGRELAWLHKRETGIEAKRLLSRAIWLEPGYAAAYSWLAFVHIIEYINQWAEAGLDVLRVADELAAKAVKLDDTDAQAHFVLGECHLWARREHDSAMRAAHHAIALDANYSHAYLLLGHALHYAGRSAESLGPYRTAMQLDPFYPDLYLHFLAQSYYSLGRYLDAAATLEERLVRNPGSDISRVLLAACYGQTGEPAKARAAWHDVFAVNKSYSIDERRRLLPYAEPAEFEHVLDGLRRAGVFA